MRIVLTVHQFLPKHSGGTEVLVLETARQLRLRKHDVHILTAESNESAQGDEGLSSGAYDGIPVHRVNWRPQIGPNRLRMHYDNPEMYQISKQLFRKLQPDVVHVFHLFRLSTAVVAAASECGAKVVFTATDFWSICPTSLLRRHDGSMCTGPARNQSTCVKCLAIHAPPPHSQVVRLLPNWALGGVVALMQFNWLSGSRTAKVLRAFLQRRGKMQHMLRSCAAIIAPTQIMADMLVRNGCDPRRVVRLGFGLNIQYTDPYQSKTASPGLRLGYVGQLVEHKGVDLLLRAYEMQRRDPAPRPVFLRIWGDAAQQPHYADRLYQLARQSNGVEFAGTFPNAEIGAIFADIDMLVVPSVWYENAPLVILTALATKTPVIATDVPGMAELVRHDCNGLLFPLGDATALANQIRRVRDDAGLWARLRDGISPVTTMVSQVAELERIYDRITAPRPVRSA